MCSLEQQVINGSKSFYELMSETRKFLGPERIKLKKESFEEDFNEIVFLVKKGMLLRDAIFFKEIFPKDFYRKLTIEQKVFLKSVIKCK